MADLWAGQNMPQRITKHVGSGQHLSINPESVARLELLIASRVMDLGAIAEVVSGDSGLRAQMIEALPELAGMSPTVNECVVELGREGMRQCLRRARRHPQTTRAE